MIYDRLIYCCLLFPLMSSRLIMAVLQVMIQILKDMGITEYEPRVINQMLEFTYSEYHTICTPPAENSSF